MAVLEAKVAVLAFEAGATVVLERDALVESGGSHGDRAVAVDPASLPTET